MGVINKLTLLIIQILLVSVFCVPQPPNRLKNFLSRAASNVHDNQKIPKFSYPFGDLVTRSLLTQPFIDTYLQDAKKVGRDSNNNTHCLRQMSHLAAGLVNLEPWALKMVDSSSKIPSGVLIGNLKDMGVYDECVSVKVDKNNDTIQGRHCMYSVADRENQIIAPTFSICLPSACNAGDLSDILEIAINTVSNAANVSIGVQSVTCSAVEPEPFDIGTILTIVFLSVYIGFLMCCTMYDLYLRTIDGKSDSALVKFSIYTNALRVLDTKVPKGNIPAIQGIRFFSMCWVVLGHRYFMQTIGVIVNGTDILTWMKSWSSLHILIAPFTVDTFFAIGGFLSSYLFIKEMAKGRKFNVFMYYLHRYLRLTPALGVMLLLAMFIFPRLGSGALWETNMKEQEGMCKSNWWAILLYVQNYVQTENLLCLGHVWYLAVDMQLFWISPIVLYPLAKKPKVGLSITAVLLIASIIIPAMISAEGKYSGALFTTIDIAEQMIMMTNFYIVTYTRMGPWLIGILLGFFLSQDRRAPSISFIRIGWIFTVLVFAFILFSYRIFQADGYTYNLYWELFYNGFARHIWALAICWFLYASITGYGGILSKFLSLPIFMPFGRISYCVYLFHFLFQIMNVSSIRVPFYFNDWRTISIFFSDFVICTFGGFVFSLLFESPFMVVEKLLFGKKKVSPRQGSKEQLEEVVENRQ